MSNWTRPRLDWQPYDFVKYTDINRIMGNCNYLTENEPTLSSESPLDTNYTISDYLYQSQWTALLFALHKLQLYYGSSFEDARNWTQMTAQNFYNVESLEYQLFDSKQYGLNWRFVSEHTKLDNNFTTGGK